MPEHGMHSFRSDLPSDRKGSELGHQLTNLVAIKRIGVAF